MRKYKQVKEKKATFDMSEWAEVERRAAAMNLKTGTYIKKIAVNGQLTYYDMQAAAPLVNAMRTIFNNINQIARRANETHSIHERDVTAMQEEVSSVCLILLKAYISKKNVNKPNIPLHYKITIVKQIGNRTATQQLTGFCIIVIP